MSDLHLQKLNHYLTVFSLTSVWGKDWDTAITESIQNPLTTLVTLDGDSFDGGYWRVGQPSTGAKGKSFRRSNKKFRTKA
ncbi:MAG: hypothetical protein Ct9H90mP11_05150 [Acidimicrobiales bacterium]|nr:MAG: hypothetical protein Ct9H90mP11_05150 [Acidimicrobiales bacterium]